MRHTPLHNKSDFIFVKGKISKLRTCRILLPRYRLELEVIWFELFYSMKFWPWKRNLDKNYGNQIFRFVVKWESKSWNFTGKKTSLFTYVFFPHSNSSTYFIILVNLKVEIHVPITSELFLLSLIYSIFLHKINGL